ncbi:MAG: glycosyltransferase family 39 protein [Deltaproteobacteria bacterium]|nr:glycosyltransferase family 39 protein [Deltaproteobacteria bacterium]
MLAVEPAPRPVARERLSWPAALLIVAYGAALYLIILAGGRTLSAHEVWLAQPAKEMLATGRWLVPTFAGVLCGHKPPLMHWAIALAMALFGSHSEWVARLPSAVAAVVAALAVASLAARWLGSRPALLAGVVQLTTVYSLKLGADATPDMLLCAAVATALSVFARANLVKVETPGEYRARPWAARAFYLASGLAFLAKGPIGLAFIWIPVGLLVLRQRRTARFLVDPAGLALAGVLLGAWPILAYREQPAVLERWLRDNWGRFHGAMGGESSPLFYLYTVLWLMLPWTVFCAIGYFALRRDSQRRELLGFLNAWFISGLALVTASAFKHWHYLAPALPPLAVLAGQGVSAYAAWRQREARPRLALQLLVIACGSAAGVTAVYGLLPAALAGRAAAVVGLVAIGLVAALFLERRGQVHWQLATWFATAGLAGVLVQGWLMAAHDSWRPYAELAERANRIIPPSQPLYLVQLPEHQIAYYLNAPLVRTDAVDGFEAAIRDSAAATTYVMAPQSVAERLGARHRVEVLDRCAALRRGMHEAERLALMAVGEK